MAWYSPMSEKKSHGPFSKIKFFCRNGRWCHRFQGTCDTTDCARRLAAPPPHTTNRSGAVTLRIPGMARLRQDGNDLTRRLMPAARRQREDPLAFIADQDVFGDLADDQRFVAAYTSALASLHLRGARATLESLA